MSRLRRKWESELSLRLDKGGEDHKATWYARGVLKGIELATAQPSESCSICGLESYPLSDAEWQMVRELRRSKVAA